MSLLKIDDIRIIICNRKSSRPKNCSFCSLGVECTAYKMQDKDCAFFIAEKYKYKGKKVRIFECECHKEINSLKIQTIKEIKEVSLMNLS